MSRKITELPEAMEARSVDALPIGERWQYEPKWDGFRYLLLRAGEVVKMLSRSVGEGAIGKLREVLPERFAFDLSRKRSKSSAPTPAKKTAKKPPAKKAAKRNLVHNAFR